MTIWDKIYKNYQKTGQKWATLQEDVMPEFVDFIKNNKFFSKKSLDIGCGLGKYLVFLESFGFGACGIDNSETAIKTTKKLLNREDDIVLADMFEYDIPDKKFDFIFSVSTIHHGYKKQVSDLIDQIHDKLIVGGKIFITLPDLASNHKWNSFKDDKEVSPGTFIPQIGPEKGLPHSFYTKEEINDVFNKFKNINLKLDEIGRWIITGEK